MIWVSRISWVKLSTVSDDDPLYRGTLFRFKRVGRKDEIVDWMLFATWQGSGLGLVRDSGHDAGIVSVVLPIEAKVEGEVAISPTWLCRHWQEWIDSRSAAGSVWVLRDGRGEPDKLPDE
ncbi:Imm45 family immunity protein [Hoeflea sp. 108]|uniref:Imm45 family immunity protein n=1 Tax=Aminobacter sp. MET-1 TaxID=2951085 RepID=UPI0012F9F924